MTTPYTDIQLKQALAKMLPDKIGYNETGEFYQHIKCIYWKNDRSLQEHKVQDTELLHLCWLVEETLDTTGDLNEPPELRDTQAGQYTYALALVYEFESIHATWQQRTIALAKVKGIEIV